MEKVPKRKRPWEGTDRLPESHRERMKHVLDRHVDAPGGKRFKFEHSGYLDPKSRREMVHIKAAVEGAALSISKSVFMPESGELSDEALDYIAADM